MRSMINGTLIMLATALALHVIARRGSTVSIFLVIGFAVPVAFYAAMAGSYREHYYHREDLFFLILGGAFVASAALNWLAVRAGKSS